MNLSHFSSFLGNFQLSRVDIWKWKILPNGSKNIFLAWRNKFLIFININRSKTADELSLWAILLKKLQKWIVVYILWNLPNWDSLIRIDKIRLDWIRSYHPTCSPDGWQIELGHLRSCEDSIPRLRKQDTYIFTFSLFDLIWNG